MLTFITIKPFRTSENERVFIEDTLGYLSGFVSLAGTRRTDYPHTSSAIGFEGFGVCKIECINCFLIAIVLKNDISVVFLFSDCKKTFTVEDSFTKNFGPISASFDILTKNYTIFIRRFILFG